MPRRSIHRRRRAQGGCLSFMIGVLAVAALAAEGESRITGVQHIDRGYEALEDTLCALGGQAHRVRGQCRPL